MRDPQHRSTRALPGLALVAVLGAASPSFAQICPGPQPEAEPNDTMATATPLTLEPATSGRFFGVPGAVSPAGDVDFFRITANAGERLWVEVDTGSPQSPGATSRDSVLQVFTGTGILLEEDDDDGTGNGQTSTIASREASIVAGLPLPVSGVYFVRVSAKSPADVLAPYVLMVTRSSSAAPEIEPNDTIGTATPPIFQPVAGGLSSPTDVDWYGANVLDFGVPWVVVDGDPERDGTSTQLVVDVTDFGGGTTLQVDSSSGQGAPPPAAEGAVLPQLAMARLSGPAAGTYLLGVFYSGDGCVVPVTLQSFEVR